LVTSQYCNTQPCPLPCEVSEWSSWDTCDVPCGYGVNHRTRHIINLNDGHCPYLAEDNYCYAGYCPNPCVKSEWSPWSPCPVTCGQGLQRRVKSKISGDAYCIPEYSEKNCTLGCCPVTCSVDDWTEWTPCSAKYGRGKQIRTRNILNGPEQSVYPVWGCGESCPQTIQIKFCYNPIPPNQCEWSSWYDWSQWSATCGTAKHYRDRILISSPSSYANSEGGYTLNETDCIAGWGTNEDDYTTFPTCPIDCLVSKWGEWGECLFPGVRYRERVITRSPEYGGKQCPTCLKEIDHCVPKINNLDPTVCEVQPCVLEVADSDAPDYKPVVGD